MVLGDNPVPPPMQKRDLLAEKLVTISFKDGNPLLPQVNLDDKLFDDLCTPWRDALVIKLLGKNVGYRVMFERLQRLWKPQGGFEILDVDNGYYMVKFDHPADKEAVASGGPWMLFDHYLCVSQWTPEFASPNANIQRTMVWICFPGLNLLYCDKNVLLAMASVIGRPIRVDQNTLNVQRGRFARVCVEIDLSKPVIGKIWLWDHWYRVEYEGLHLICANCGCYGHMTRECSKNPTIPPLAVTPENQKETSQTLSGDTVSHTSTQEVPPTSTGSPMTFSLYVSQGASGIVYDLEKHTHGEWLTVSRRKKVVKEPPKNTFAGLTTSIQQTNNAMGYPPNGGGTKPSSKPKRRR